MSRTPGGARTFANWDEDSVTMGVEAARQALTRLTGGSSGAHESSVMLQSLQLASTTFPFADRSNAGLIREALNLNNDLSPADLGGSRRAAVSGLLSLLNRDSGQHLLCASDCVDAKPGSDSEYSTGHAAASAVIGDGKPLALLRASGSLHEDFVDQYRMTGQTFDYPLEPRWVRDAGTMQQLGQLIPHVLDQAQLTAGDIQWLLLPTDVPTGRALAGKCGLGDARTAEALQKSLGMSGAAYPLVMLAWALEQAQPGDNILLAGAGQGFDLLLFEVQPSVKDHQGKVPAHTTVEAQLDAGQPEENYTRYLGLRRLLDLDTGIRGERDNRTAQSAFYRRHEDITGFNGGRCSACDKLQFPMSRYCVHCHADDTQIPEPMAGLQGEVNSYTEDWLALTPRPPLMFGNIHFPGSANVMMEFSDFLPGELAAGMRVKMSFRIKELDTRRHFRRYFWKPVPLAQGDRDG